VYLFLKQPFPPSRSQNEALSMLLTFDVKGKEMRRVCRVFWAYGSYVLGIKFYILGIQTARSKFVPLIMVRCVPVVFQDIMILKVRFSWLILAYLFDRQVLSVGCKVMA